MHNLKNHGVRHLRALVRAHGWHGSSVEAAKRRELEHYLICGERPPTFYFDHIGELIAVLSSVPEKSTNQERNTRKIGRPSRSLPDTSLLLSAIHQAWLLGNPFRKSGKNGVHARREALPAVWQNIGRDRLERLIDELIMAGEIASIGGKMSITEK